LLPRSLALGTGAPFGSGRVGDSPFAAGRSDPAPTLRAGGRFARRRVRAD